MTMTWEDCKTLREKLGKSRLIYEHLEILKFMEYIYELYLDGTETFEGACLAFFTLGYLLGNQKESLEHLL